MGMSGRTHGKASSPSPAGGIWWEALILSGQMLSLYTLGTVRIHTVTNWSTSISITVLAGGFTSWSSGCSHGCVISILRRLPVVPQQPRTLPLHHRRCQHLGRARLKHSDECRDNRISWNSFNRDLLGGFHGTHSIETYWVNSMELIIQ